MTTEPSSFTIRELTGERRAIVLRGRGLPFRPIDFSGSQRLDVTWYAGSPEGTLQVLGAQEHPTTIRGRWSNRFISRSSDDDDIDAALSVGLAAGQPPRPSGALSGDKQAPASVDGISFANVNALVKEMDSVRRQGQQVEVTWGAILRRGVLSKFLQKWQTTGIVEWEATFTWVSQDLQELKDVPVQSTGYDFDTSTNRLFDLLTTIPESPFKVVNGFISDLQSGILAIEDAQLTNLQTIQSGFQTAKRVMALYEFMKERADNFVLASEFTAEAGALNDEEDAGLRLATRKEERDKRKSARLIADISAGQQSAIAKNLDPELVRVFTAREGQDLREVSTLYYGTPDSWRSLLVFNGLDTSKLSSGQLVFVPRTPSSEEC